MSEVISDSPTAPAGQFRKTAHVPVLVLLGALWVWAVSVCVPFWQTNPNYSYGWVVPLLVVFYLWRRLASQTDAFWQEAAASSGEVPRINPWLLALPALALFPLEVYRVEYHQSGIVLWVINLFAVAASLAAAWWLGGRRLLGVVAFPLLFFLTAVPWPAKIANPLLQGLMKGVALVITDALLWLGVPVTAEGATLTLTNGTVGIVEACSGIRSLQSGLMVSLAVGELLLLTWRRRAALVGLGILLALGSNLVRTFVLCMFMEKQGEAGMNKWHDTVGNVAMYSLYILIWLGGKWLERGREADFPAGFPNWRAKLAGLAWPRLPDVRPLVVVAALTFAVVHGWYFLLKLEVKPQTEPLFTLRTAPESGNEKTEFDEFAWRSLGADGGEQLRRKVPELPLGWISAYHLFWRPSPMSKVALHHRPDICMPGSGWNQVGEVEQVRLDFHGQPLIWYVFRFERDGARGMQIWGVWRNGQSVEMDYSNRLTALPEVYRPYPSSRHMMSVELISLFVPYRDEPPPSLSIVEKVLPEILESRAAAAALARNTPTPTGP